MPDSIAEQLSLIEELDRQQNALLDELDALNKRIEAVLASLGDSLAPAPVSEDQPIRRAA
jgi:hypothetical protein